MNKSRKILYTIIFVTLLIVFSIGGGEFVCRVADKLVNSKTLPDYMDIARPDIGTGGYLKENFDNLVIDGYGRPVRFKTNSAGFRYYKDVSFNPGPGVIRILSLGDSFTAGYRIGQEQTFSRLMEKYFNAKKGNKYEVLISLIIQPGAGLHYLSTYGIKFKPSVVILGITVGNDIAENTGVDVTLVTKTIPDACLTDKQIVVYHSDNSLIKKSKLYKKLTSLFQRYTGEAINSWHQEAEHPMLFDLMNGLGFFIKDAPEEITNAYNQLSETLAGYKRIAMQYNFKLIVVIFPQRFQVQKEDWKMTAERYGLRSECFDLMKPNRLISDYCKRNDIICIDPTVDMTAVYDKKRKNLYFSLGDMHWNALGNRVLCDVIKDKIYRIINDN